MRIGIDIRELEENRRTGIGRFILNFLYYVSAYDKENEYLLFGNQHTACPSLGGNIQLRIIPEFSRIFWDQVILRGETAKEKIELFFSPFYKAPVFFRAKSIVTCHDLYFLELEKNPVKKWLRAFYCRLIWNRANLIITVSQYSKKEVVKFLGCEEQKVRVVYDGVEDRFRPMEKGEAFSGLIKRFSRLRKDFILYVGNFKPHKNVARIIRAYNLLPQALKDKYQLVMAGGGDKLAGSNDLAGKLEILDAVSEDELVYLYNAAAALVLVSLREGFGLPALEAMACGTPVVVSNTAALPEVAGEAGLYVNPEEVKDIACKIERIITDEELRKELSEKGLVQAKKFRAEYSARKILEIFKELKG